MVYSRGFLIVSLILSVIVFNTCTRGKDVKDQEPLVIRIANEPDNLFPVYSKSAYATPIEQLIFYPLAEFDPQTLQLTPLLVESLTRPDTLEEGEYAGGLAFHYKIRPEAEWSDGVPVTAKDYVFTLKAVFNAHAQASNWKSYLSFIRDVDTDPSDPKKLTVYVGEPYMLAEAVVVNFNILPAHVYDSTGVLDAFTIGELRTMEKTPLPAERDSILALFGKNFRDVDRYRTSLEGSGPYVMESWDTGEAIRLKRKDDWWGDKVRDRPLLMHAYPQYIEYRIIPDETTALNALKEGSVDLIPEVSPQKFIEMRNDSQYHERFNFFTPAIMRYHFLELNNQIPELKDAAVRKALAYSIDYNTMINHIVHGLGSRTVGPFHPDMVYYNKDIEPIPYDLEMARYLLKEAGWEDTNQDGTVDKMIDGRRQELVLDVLVTQKEEGQNLAILLKRNAEKAGIGIRIQTTEGSKLLQDWRTRNFEVIPLYRGSYPGYVDPYQSWHSESNNPSGNNRAGYESDVADSLITHIRSSVDLDRRNALYYQLQEQIFEDQPVIFLYVPLERIIASKKYEIETTARRPGYCENLIQLKAG